MATSAAAGAASPAESSVVLINIFEVAPAQEEAFVAAWKDAREYFKQQDGYINTKLHKSLQADARYRFVNVAEYQSAQHYQAAVGSEAFRQVAQGVRANVISAAPALYRVVAE